MSPKAWTEDAFPLSGEIEDKYRQKKKRLIQEKIRGGRLYQKHPAVFYLTGDRDERNQKERNLLR
mgnify:FL=1